MIYIKNNTEIQTIFIPRTELQKEAYIASTKTYEDGYKDGFGKGKQYQKDQLLNLYVTENGEYEREDGWGTVTVDMSIPDCSGAYDEGYNQGYEDGQNSVECPEGGTCNLGEGEIYLTASDAGFYELYAADDGYDGWSKFYVTLENGGAIKIHRAEELIQMFNEGVGIDFGAYCYVGGKITEIQEINVEYGNATYVLDNGFKVYRGKWIDDNPFGEDQIKVGAYIVVYGIIQDYKGELQLKAHSQVIAYQECEGGEISCNLLKETFTLKGDYEQFTASEYGADGFESVTIDAYDYGRQKFNEGYEEGINQGGTVTTYSTIRDIYNTEDVTTEVNFKGTVAVCLTNGSTYYMIVTDHTGAIYVTAKQPYDVGDECFLAGVVKKTNSTNMRYMSNPIIEVLSRGNYVVMPTDAVELTNTSDLYIPNNFGNAEMKYLYYQGEVQKIASNGNITITTPESVSAEGRIILRTAKEKWRYNLVVGDYIRMYMFTTNSDGYFLPTDIIKLGTEGGSCNLEDKRVTPSMGERDDNGLIVVEESEGFDGLSRVVIDPTTIYNEGVEEGRNQGGGSGDCNIQDNKTVELDGDRMGIYPDEGYNGISEVIVEAGRKAEEWREEGRNGVRNKLQSIEITENGRYSADDTELIDYIEFDGNSYFDTNIPFGKNTKIEVAITKTTYEKYEQFIGVAQYHLNTAEIYDGFGIVAGAGLAFGVFGQAKTENIGFSYEEEQILTLDRNGLNSSLTGGGGWLDESGLDYDGLYGQTIGIGKIKSVSDGWIYRGLNGRIRYVKIWTDGNDDSTMTLFRPKNMAQGGFGLVNSDGIEFNYVENIGEGTTTFISEWERKYGEGWKEINVNVECVCPSVQEQITDYIYNQLTLYSYRNIGFDDLEGCFYDSNNEPITDVLVVCKKVDFEYSFKFFTKVPIKTCSKIPYPNTPLYGLTRLYFNSIPSVNLNYKDNNVLSLYIEDVDYLNMDGATLNGLLRIWLKGTTTFSQGLEIGTAQIKDSGTVYSDGTNTDKLSSSFSTWTIINDHKLP